MRFAHDIPRGVRMPFLNESSAADALVQLNFYLQPQKVSKKGRSMAMLFIQQSAHFCRVLLASLGTLLRPAKQPDKRTPRGTSGLLRGSRVSFIRDV